MIVWFVTEWSRDHVELVEHWFPGVGFIDEFKALVRSRGGRVLAVVRPKRNLARELNQVTGRARVSG